MSNKNPRPNVRMTEEEFYNKLVHLGAPQDVLEANKMSDPGNKQYVFDWVMNNVVGRQYNGIIPDLHSGDRGSIPAGPPNYNKPQARKGYDLVTCIGLN